MASYSRRRSMAQERRAAADVGGRVQIASGATPFAKSDVRKMGELRVECKTTRKALFSLKRDDILKLRKEAISQGLEMWVFQVEFQKSAGFTKKLAVLDAAWFKQLGGKITETHCVYGKSSPLSSLVRYDLDWEWVRPGSPVINHLFLTVCSWEEFLRLWEDRE